MRPPTVLAPPPTPQDRFSTAIEEEWFGELFVDDLPTNVEAAEKFGWNGIVYQPDGGLIDKLRAAGVEVGTN